MTLRITRAKDSRSRTTLKLEGRLAAEWVALLERECSRLLRSRATVILDFSSVTYIDRAGAQALVRLTRRGVVIRCRPGAVASVLEGEGIPVTWNSD